MDSRLPGSLRRHGSPPGRELWQLWSSRAKRHNAAEFPAPERVKGTQSHAITLAIHFAIYMRTRLGFYPVSQIWVGADAAQIAHHVHVAIASCHVQSSLSRLKDSMLDK